MANRFKL